MQVIQFMLIPPISHKKFGDMAIVYEYKTDTDTTNLLRDPTPEE